MSKQVSIRRARREDCKEIARLIQELAVFEKMGDSPRTSVQELERDGFDTNPPLYQSFVVEDPDQDSTETCRRLIGYAIYYIGYSTWNGKKFYLEDIFITETSRNQKIGDQLFRRLCQEAVHLDCQVMNFTVLNWNPAQKFYKRFGSEDITASHNWHFYTLDKESFHKAASSS